jgi:hypothetical protein
MNILLTVVVAPLTNEDYVTPDSFITTDYFEQSLSLVYISVTIGMACYIGTDRYRSFVRVWPTKSLQKLANEPVFLREVARTKYMLCFVRKSSITIAVLVIRL